MTEPRLRRVDRLLMALLLRGPGAEFVVGDLVERYAADVRSLGERGARRRLRRAVLSSGLAWWMRRVRGGAGRVRSSGSSGAAAGSHEHESTRGTGTMMTGWTGDLRIAARGLVRRPGFTAGVALTLGLGIGATSAIFSVVDGVVLRPLPYAEAERLVAIGTTFPNREWADEEAGLQHLAGINMLNVRDFAERARSVEAVSGMEPANVLLPDRGDGPELASAARAGADFFTALGVSPALGRVFLPEEERPGGPSVMILSYGAWQRRFGADPDVIGRPLEQLAGTTTIVGVLPADFRVPEAFLRETPDFWLPLQPEHERYAGRGMRSLYVVGRLAEGADLASARAEATAIAAELAEQFPDGNVYPDGSWFGIGMNGLRAETVGTSGRTLRVFVGAAGLLLLLATMNSATLLLGRALDRVHELGIRVALGVGRMGVVRLLLAEAALLALAGAAVGLAIAVAGVEGFVRLAPRTIPRLDEIAVDGRVLGVAVTLSLGAGLAAGLLPALRVTGGRAIGTHAGARTAGGRSRLRALLVAAQVATALVLLSGGGLLLTSFARIVSVDPGFDPDGVVTMNLALKRPGATETSSWQGWDLALEELSSVPGLTGLAGTTNPPFQSPYWAPRIILPGDPEELRREGIAGYAVTPGYLDVIGTRLVSGRGFERTDGPDSEPVLLVNEAFVRTQLGGADPVGMTVRNVDGDTDVTLRVVGVIEDVVQTSADEGFQPAVYFPYTQTEWPLVQIVARSDRSPADLIPELRQAAARFSPALPPSDVRTMRDRMAASRRSQRFQTALVGALAAVALLLSALGLYGSLAHAVGSRRREMGVRMALGSRRSSVARLVLRQGLATVAVGLAVGLPVSLFVNGLLSGFLYDVEPRDPLTLTVVALLLVAVSTAACLIPARRATRVDPVEVLRAE